MNESDNENSPADGLTPKQLQIIPYLVVYPCISEAAGKARVSRNTIYEWMKIPAFQAELERQRLASYDDVLAKFSALGDQAIVAYKQLLEKWDSKRAVASDIIKHIAKARAQSAISQRLNELARRQDEILKRLASIEDAMKKREKPKPQRPKLTEQKK